MNYLFAFAAQNTVVAVIMALFVSGLTRIWRNPPVAHVLWLLVLLKLVAPPVMRIDWTALRLESTPAVSQKIADVPPIVGRKAHIHPSSVGRPTARMTEPASETSLRERDFAASLWVFWNQARLVLLSFWLVGAVMSVLVAATR